MRWRSLAGCAALALAAAGVAAAQGAGDRPTAAETRERARTLLADAVFQTELPDGGGRATGSGRGQVGDRSRQAPEASPEGRAPQRRAPQRRAPSQEPLLLPGGTVLRAFFWVVLAVVLITALSSTLQEVRRGRRRRMTAGEDETESEPAVGRPAAAVDEIEALAGAERYTEAAHLLLQRALERFGRRRRLDHSLTSREILAGEEVGAGREALAVLVETVERSWFGGRAVDRRAYEQCLAAHRQLAEAW